MLMKTLLLSLFMLPQLLIGEILESSKFEEILNYIQQNHLLIVCDIDNTLLMSSTQLGSVAWGDHVISTLESKGISKRDANLIQNIFWKTVQPYITVKLVDPHAIEVLETIQQMQIPFIALTARAPHEEAYTTTQLFSLGLHWLHAFSHRIELLEQNALYDNGILYANPINKKSEVLFTFLEQQNIAPESIIFIDDKWSHVLDMEKACSERNIHYIGVRFGAADDQVKNYNPSITEIQWEAFPQILSDEEAQIFLLPSKFIAPNRPSQPQSGKIQSL